MLIILSEVLLLKYLCCRFIIVTSELISIMNKILIIQNDLFAIIILSYANILKFSKFSNI